MKVAKFGGSSSGTPERVANVAKIIKDHPEYQAVVVSAYEGVTNELIRISKAAAQRDESYRDLLARLSQRHVDAAKFLLAPKVQGPAMLQIKLWTNELEDALQGVSLLCELTKRSLDFVMSFGERLSAFILAETLKAQGFNAYYLDASTVIRTDERFGGAKVDFVKTASLVQEQFSKNAGLAITTGFIAGTDRDEIATLGRGGSDYTAAILGAALTSEEIAIWTDVDGMLTADPRKVPKAFPLHSLSYEEAMELCHFGAKVIYPPTLQPALDKNIPIRILNTFKPSHPGTLICEKPEPHNYAVTGISSIENISLVRVEGNGLIGVAGISGRLFSALAAQGISVILISQASSEHSICFAVMPEDAVASKQAIDQCFSLEIKSGMMVPAITEGDLSVVSVVGENMRRVPGISAKFFSALGRNGINIVAIAQGSSELNISVVVKRNDEAKALRAVHDSFFVTQSKSLHLFLIGAGQIGKTLLTQIAKQLNFLRQELNLELKLVGVANSKKMLFDEKGIAPLEAQALLEKSSTSQEITSFIREMRALNLPNSVYIDCTASDEVAARYAEILDASIPVITPNKRAQSERLQRYQEIKTTALKRGVEFLFETSVGAGLPVISTLNDLVRSGDRIIKIEAVLSGTLSFLFNTACAEPGMSFSALVAKAKSLGYTEPDPRDDLGGKDVARKILILAREAGITAELKDVVIEPLLSKELFALASVDEFMKALKESDKAFDAKRSKALAAGKRLCFIASVDHSQTPAKLHATLEEIDSTHPFYSLSGSDNIISFTTERYRERPLVVRGPGAGAEVTAAGVFADIIRIGKFGT